MRSEWKARLLGRRARSFARVAAAVACACLFFVLASSAVHVVKPSSGATAATSPTILVIDAPSETAAGSALDVRVAGAISDRTDVSLGVFGAVESTLLQAVATNGVARFTIEDQLLDHAGRVTLVAQVGQTQTRRDLVVRAGPPTEPVVPLVGPRTIIADGEDVTMVVISASDAFGNPLPDGTQADVHAAYSDGSTEALDATFKAGIASSVLRATTRAGRVSITADVKGRSGPANVVDQVAGRPARFEVKTTGASTDVDQFYADGFTPYEISTTELLDPFGNVMPDGLVVTFSATSADGITTASATVQGGYATTTLQSPRTPGDIIIGARTSGQDSLPLTIAFASAVESLAVDVGVALDGSRVVEIGPVIGRRGGYVADATIVTIRSPHDGGTLATGALHRGHVAISLRDPELTTVIVDVLGEQRSVSVARPS